MSDLDRLDAQVKQLANRNAHLPLSVRDALENVVDVIRKEKTNGH